MALTDQLVLTEIQYHLIEVPDQGQTWGSGLWTVAEVSNYLNRRQDRFLKETGCVLKRATQPIVAHNSRQEIPEEVIALRHVAWKNAVGTPVIVPLLRSDHWDLDHGFPAWQTATDPTHPSYFADTDLPTRQVAIAPPVGVAGSLELLYSYVGATLSNAGVAFTVPDIAVAPVKYGVMADMLSKVGRAQDPARAAFCETRFQEGIEVVQLLLSGGVG